MLTQLTIRNFKSFEKVEVELGDPVVFIGPNNSGKTTALQALALWNIGLKKWREKRSGQAAPEKRPGVAINRRDLISVPIPSAQLLWRNLHVRDVQKINGKQDTKNIRIEIVVEGVSKDTPWTCGLEFDYANDESLYCRPLRLGEGRSPERMKIPDEAGAVDVSFLQPMSGLASEEYLKQTGEIGVLIGQGRTAEVLRNLCRNVADGEAAWDDLGSRMRGLFGVDLNRPTYVPETSRILMTYNDRGGCELDLTSAGRGLQQTLLLLAYMWSNPGAVLLLDEPDAHLEILRQRQIYDVLTETARKQSSQLLIASHSEVILEEAADRDVVVAFVGKPHRIDDRGSQVAKSLKAVGFDQYYQAELTGWVLYLEGSTDLAILRAFAKTLDHAVAGRLERPFIHYVENQPSRGRDHFRALREAKPDLVGMILCDRLELELQPTPELRERMWRRREIENYVCSPKVLLRFASEGFDASDREVDGAKALTSQGPLFDTTAARHRESVMDTVLLDLVPARALRDPADQYWIDLKASDNLLDRLFPEFFAKLGLPADLMRKTDYHRLARYVSKDEIDPEIAEVLDEIEGVADSAAPTES